MSAVAYDLALASRIVREAVKDRSYRATPLGLEVARYYRWKKNEWGARPTTMRDYEAILRNLAVYFADLELKDLEPPVGTERLRECMAYFWDTASPRTRNKVRSVWLDFFEWACDERGLYGNPARRLHRARVQTPTIETFPTAIVNRILAGQSYPSDHIGADLILRYAVRRGGLEGVQLKHFDAEAKVLTVNKKGGGTYPVPIPDDALWGKLLALTAEGLGPESYLLYRQDTRRRRVPIGDAEEVLELGRGRKHGYATVVTRKHDEPPTGKVVHLWWYRCLERAGLVAKGTTAGTNMHRGRHTAITKIVRGTHNLKLAQQLAGHSDIRTTAMYAHLDTADLADALSLIYEDD